MSAKSLLQISLDNCLLVRDSLHHRQADLELMTAVLDCIVNLETLLEGIDRREDWDAESFQSFLTQFRQERRVQREVEVLAHLKTPLRGANGRNCPAASRPAAALSQSSSSTGAVGARFGIN